MLKAEKGNRTKKVAQKMQQKRREAKERDKNQTVIGENGGKSAGKMHGMSFSAYFLNWKYFAL